MDDKRLAVTLTNGRSHVLDLPDGIEAAAAAEVIRGGARGSEIGWELGDGEWLSYGNGAGWVDKRTIAEITLVDFSGDRDLYIHEEYR